MTEKKEDAPKEIKKAIKKISKNYWAVATIVLAILLIVSFYYGKSSVPEISKTAAGQKVIDFIESRGGEAQLIEVNDNGALYEVIVSIEDQQLPIYMTKDGKNLIPSLIPLEPTTTPDTPIQTPTPQNIPKSDKPKVELFVMSHCPYGTQIEKGIIPVVKLLEDKIDFELKFVYYAMHGKTEVEEQLNQYCIQKEQNDKFIPYLECFLTESEGDECLTKVKIDKTKLKTCTDKTDDEFSVLENLNNQSSWLSGKFPQFNVHKTDNDKYSIGGSPTLIINEQEASAGRDSTSLLSAICSAFNTAPEECATELSSASPSPGFGYTTTAGATTTAQCG